MVQIVISHKTFDIFYTMKSVWDGPWFELLDSQLPNPFYYPQDSKLRLVYHLKIHWMRSAPDILQNSKDLYIKNAQVKSK